MTQSGGTAGDGNIFRINTDGSGFQNLLSFSGTAGNIPVGSLTLSGSTLYGMTLAGGVYGDGNIFRVNTDGSDYTDMFSFNGTDGADPEGSLTLSGSTLFGTDPKHGTVLSIPVNAVYVPEPSTLILLGVGAIGFATYAWRKRRQAA